MKKIKKVYTGIPAGCTILKVERIKYGLKVTYYDPVKSIIRVGDWSVDSFTALHKTMRKPIFLVNDRLLVDREYTTATVCDEGTDQTRIELVLSYAAHTTLPRILKNTRDVPIPSVRMTLPAGPDHISNWGFAAIMSQSQTRLFRNYTTPTDPWVDLFIRRQAHTPSFVLVMQDGVSSVYDEVALNIDGYVVCGRYMIQASAASEQPDVSAYDAPSKRLRPLYDACKLDDKRFVEIKAQSGSYLVNRLAVQSARTIELKDTTLRKLAIVIGTSTSWPGSTREIQITLPSEDASRYVELFTSTTTIV